MNRSVIAAAHLLIAVVLTTCGANIPARAVNPPRIISFTSTDGGVISAAEYGSGPRALVLVPGGRFEKSSWGRQAPQFAAAGFRVLAIDLRGRGSSRAGSAGADSVHLDVLAAVFYARSTGANRVSVLGASLGGGAAGEALIAAEPNSITALVLLAPSPVEKPELLVGRKLFIVAEGDTRGSGIWRLPEIRDQFERAPDPKELLVLPGTAHAQMLFQTEQEGAIMQSILRFLLAHQE